MEGGVRRRALCFVLALGLAGGCGWAENAVDADAVEAAEARSEATTAMDEAAGEAAADLAEGETPQAGTEGAEKESATAKVATTGFEEPELRTYRLLLVNPRSVDAVIHASAGAASVVLDTVRAGDSTRVNVEVRSDRLLLEAADFEGGPLGSEEIELSEEEPSRWAVPAASG